MKKLNLYIILAANRLVYAACARLIKLVPDEQRFLFLIVASAQIEAQVVKSLEGK